jgi:flavin-binding protein dodecin
MSEHVYKIIELTGTSDVGIEKAVEGAIEKASKTLKNIRWFQVTETRGSVKDGKVDHWQVSLKLGFTMND